MSLETPLAKVNCFQFLLLGHRFCSNTKKYLQSAVDNTNSLFVLHTYVNLS